jgi:hypothetical protein
MEYIHAIVIVKKIHLFFKNLKQFERLCSLLLILRQYVKVHSICLKDLLPNAKRCVTAARHKFSIRPHD